MGRISAQGKYKCCQSLWKKNSHERARQKTDNQTLNKLCSCLVVGFLPFEKHKKKHKICVFMFGCYFCFKFNEIWTWLVLSLMTTFLF